MKYWILTLVAATALAIAITVLPRTDVDAYRAQGEQQASLNAHAPSPGRVPTHTSTLGGTRENGLYFGGGAFGRYSVIDGPPFAVRLVSTERNPITQAWERSEASYSISFDARSCKALTAHDFFIFGYGRNLELVFERWTMPCVKGSYCTTRDLPGTTVGVPAPESTTLLSIEGGTYIPVDQRSRLQALPSRVEVYRGTDLTSVSAWNVDPEGRFLFACSTAEGVLLRIDLNEPQVLVIYTSTELPILTSVLDINPVKHTTMGRGWCLLGAGAEETYLWDFDNDGVTDQVESLTAAENATRYPFSSFIVPIP